MLPEKSLNDIFRFVQLRPPVPAQQTDPIPLIDDSELAVRLQGAQSPESRSALASEALLDDDTTVRRVSDLPLGTKISEALAALRGQANATTKELLKRVGATGPAGTLERGRLLLSDTLLASFFATRDFPEDLNGLQDVYRVYDWIRRQKPSPPPSEPLARLLARPIVAPFAVRPANPAPPSPPPAPEIPAPTDQPLPGFPTLAAAVDELARMDRSGLVVRPQENGRAPEDGRIPFTLTDEARGLLSASTSAVLAARAVDLTAAPLHNIVSDLASEARALTQPAAGLPIQPVQPETPVTPLPGSPRAQVRPAGVADLLVVKQQIKRYEAGEIAHVENVLAGEKKSRAHRQLERSEETFLSETEVTRERETEIQTAERFELNRETSRTIQEDQQYNLGLSVSGKYGPTVEFSSNFEMNIDKSREETAKSSSTFARNVVERSLDRLSERVFEQRMRKLIRETEETNLHELDNRTGEHVRGIYQFIDKVYEAQVFNYGIREMFDFMVPEPASFLWHLQQHPDSGGLSIPPGPPRLEQYLGDANGIQDNNYKYLSAIYGATDVEPPPLLYLRITNGIRHGGQDGSSEENQPRSAAQVDLKLPAGYRPWRAWVRCVGLTDENPVIAVNIGHQNVVWQPDNRDRIGLSDGHEMAFQPQLYFDLSPEPWELTTDSKLQMSVVAWETNTYSVDVTLLCARTDEAMEAWRLATYAKIRAAYEERQREHQQLVEKLRAEAEAKAERESQRPFGAPPSENRRTILTELKKHCLSIVTRQRYDSFDATQDGTPPTFDFDEAETEGSFIRFFEQAFEWDQMQWVFYPYFWARKATWAARFLKDDTDPQFREFLQAGAARVVVPVRPGFEVAVTHFLETGKLWNGTGEPPQINSPLYVSIVDEIKDRTGASKGEVAVGEPWEVRIPTALLLLRGGADLPQWERTAPGKWEWRPVEPAPEGGDANGGARRRGTRAR